jgi:hypothetical protein
MFKNFYISYLCPFISVSTGFFILIIYLIVEPIMVKTLGDATVVVPYLLSCISLRSTETVNTKDS